uniref:Major facilitator superfamily (MFS) profile domain-containing protein n=1 Tax=Bionectria ochroleuca TaxID=29856 RepID=A0A8H7TTN2_BIOOC
MGHVGGVHIRLRRLPDPHGHPSDHLPCGELLWAGSTCAAPASARNSVPRDQLRRRQPRRVGDSCRNSGEVLACVGYSLAQNGHAFFVSGMVTAMGGLGSASIQAAITKHVPSDKVGQVLGAIGMLHALSRVIGPLAFQGLYAATVKTLPQAFLMVLGGLFCVAFTGALLLKPHVHWATQSVEEEETEQLTPSEEILGANSRHTLPIDEDQVTMR